MYHPILRPGTQSQLKNIGDADLVIGLPSYKNAQTAAHVARVALAGAHQHYPYLRTVLINADAGLKATTRRAVAAQGFHNGHNSIVVSGRYEGLLGQGSAVAALLDAALAIDAKAIIILDSHTQSIAPNWIAGLADLILENKADLVMPRYRQWSWPDATLSDLIVYPLFRALWGQSLRHPAAPDFALSPQLATALLDEDIWGTAVASFGLSPWLATYSTLGHWRTAQSALGEKRSDSALSVFNFGLEQKRPAKKIEQEFEARFQDVLNVMLSTVFRYRNCWQDIGSFRSLPTLTQFASAVKPKPAPEIDITLLLDNLALGWIEYRALWQRILIPENLVQIESLATLPPESFYFPPDLWARIVYDFVVVFNKGEIDPAQVVSSLFPLYQGRLAAFCQEVAGLASVGREGTIAAQAVEFEEARSYLKMRWQTYQTWNRND
jgi:hypothetical protein